MTREERMIMANQFRILSLLDKENSEDHKRDAETLEDGHAYLYNELFSRLSESSSEEVGEETHRILSMFRGIDNAVKGLSKEELAQLDIAKLTFEGFDGNHAGGDQGGGHHSFAHFIIEKKGLYSEHDAHDLNSHSSLSLPKYRAMLAAYDAAKQNGRVDFEGLKSIADAASNW